MLIKIPKSLSCVATFFKLVKESGGEAYFVGGCVRDALLGKLAKDFDIEIFKLSKERVEELIFQSKIRFDIVGRSFGVFKGHGIPVDFALPRRESKKGFGHTGFEVIGDPTMTLKEAAARRDFTINAIYYDPLEDKVFDPYLGVKDLEDKKLRHVSDAFIEDPLRVLRAMQFLSRFSLSITPETLEICSKITPEGLSSERIFDEWVKLLTLGEKPSIGLQFLKACGWVHYFPELNALIGCQQDPHWHPEGDVWEHTLCSLDVFAKEKIGDSEEDLIVGMATLCHDFGKPATTFFSKKDNRYHAYGHEVAGIEPAKTFIQKMTANKHFLEDVLVLVECHMRPRALFCAHSGDAAIRKLATKVKRMDRLMRVCSADANGSAFGHSVDYLETEKWINKRIEDLRIKTSPPSPLILGRHLQERGLTPGPDFKIILDECFEAQLEGKFDNDISAKDFLSEYLLKKHQNIKL